MDRPPLVDGMDTPRPDHFDEACPPRLRDAESAAVRERRRVNRLPEDAPAVGFALSGGGIRSATFCLGLFQALAQGRLIRRIDYLSTVSGGGYFGSFLGAAFVRERADAASVERELADNHSWPISWLRENGRFLSPNGSGDNWLTAAVALRNWIALHFVLLTFAFFVLGLGVLARCDLANASFTQHGWGEVERFFWERPALHIWWSPWLTLPAIPFVCLMFPAGFFYWATQLPSAVVVVRWAAGIPSRVARTMTTAEFASFLQIKLTRIFMVGLVAVVVLLVYALIDSFGQTAYLYWAANDFAFPSLWAGLTATGFAAYAFGTKIAIAAERVLRKKQFRVPFDLLALALALVWLLLISVGLSILAYGLAWRWRYVWDDGQVHVMSGGWSLLVAVVLCFGLSWIFSRSFGFVNLSSMQQIYSSRLSRAYLGASNPMRRRHANHSMTDLIPGDELPLHEYCPHRKGGPLHLINVTVNETISGKTQIERRDRKGLAMAVGPCGLSIGTEQHALWGPPEAHPDAHAVLRAIWEMRRRPIIPLSTGWSRAPAKGSVPAPAEPPNIESLSLGRWIAISGAAFTTGAGANTRLGLSLLLGLANVRLGYWWNSGVASRRKPGGSFIELASFLISRVLPVQTCLMGEFFARFHGTGRRHWYLSDGGHFENTACYELIRRRVPLIFCSDAGQDPRYQFEDLANLVRKARTDFGAEIEMVYRNADLKKDDPGLQFPMPTLEQIVHPELLDVIGTPEDFPALADPDAAADSSARPSWARRHALLARIHYLDTDEFCWLLMIKPSLMGDESMDVIQYQRTHPLFPQEPTSDQFFDEAQWESYRKLGEHIGRELFTPPTAAAKGWSPSLFAPPVVG